MAYLDVADEVKPLIAIRCPDSGEHLRERVRHEDVDEVTGGDIRELLVCTEERELGHTRTALAEIVERGLYQLLRRAREMPSSMQDIQDILVSHLRSLVS